MKRCPVGSRCGNDNGIRHSAVFFESANYTSYRRCLLTDGNIDTNNAAILLIDNRIDGNSRFAGTAVTDNQFTLASTDRNHRVDSFNPCLQRYLYRLAVGNTRRLDFNTTRFFRLNVAFAVNRSPQGIYDTADHTVTYRNAHNATCTTNRIAFFNQVVFTEQYGADIIFFQV